MYAFGTFIYWIDFSYHVDDRLKIYMSKETQNKLAEKFVKSNVGLQQAQLFAGHAGLKLKNKLSS